MQQSTRAGAQHDGFVHGGADYIAATWFLRLTMRERARVEVLDNLTTGVDWAVAPSAALLIGTLAINRAWGR